MDSMPEPISVPAVPRPAASVVIVREAAAGAPEPLEVWMIRRHESMKFLGGYYAFPGGRVDASDAAPDVLACCHGVSAEMAEVTFPGHDGGPALAFWVAAVRELLEESGILFACDADGRSIDGGDPVTRALITELRRELMAGAGLSSLLARRGWRCDLRGLRYLAHYITPPTSPIRFTARFFLCRVPHDQPPALFTEETSEAFWIHPGEGYRRFIAGEMKMAEPAENGLGYLAQFRSLDDLWSAHADGRHKYHGIGDRVPRTLTDAEWKRNRFPALR